MTNKNPALDKPQKIHAGNFFFKCAPVYEINPTVDLRYSSLEKARVWDWKKELEQGELMLSQKKSQCGNAISLFLKCPDTAISPFHYLLYNILFMKYRALFMKLARRILI